MQLLLRLGFDLALLRATRVPGWQDVYKRLVDPREFRGAAFELQVASQYTQVGRRVAFVPRVPGQRTCDLLVDGSIEVECKHKAGTSEKDHKRLQIYASFSDRVRKLARESQEDSSLSVELHFHVEPTSDMLREVLLEARRLSRAPHFTVAHGQDVRRSYRMAKSTQLPKTVSLSGSRPEEDRYDYVEKGGAVVAEDSGLMRREHDYAVYLECDQESDHVTSIHQSLRSARKQFTRTRPSIVHINESEVLGLVSEGERQLHQRVVREVQAFLAKTNSISAAVLESTVFPPEHGGRLHASNYAISSKNASHPLPNGVHMSGELVRSGG